MSKREFSFDPKCLDLAIYFYPAASAHRLNDLAQRIQDTVEAEDIEVATYREQRPAPETPVAPCGAKSPDRHVTRRCQLVAGHDGAHRYEDSMVMCSWPASNR